MENFDNRSIQVDSRTIVQCNARQNLSWAKDSRTHLDALVAHLLYPLILSGGRTSAIPSAHLFSINCLKEHIM